MARGGVPPPPYRGSSLDHSTSQRLPAGGASSGSGHGSRCRSAPRLTSSSRSSPSRRRRTAARTPARPARRRRRRRGAWRANDRILPPQPQQVAVQRVAARRSASRSARSSLQRRNVCADRPGRPAAPASRAVARLGNCARNSRPPLADQLAPAPAGGRRSNRNGLEAANSCPWNSIGVPGASSSSAVSAGSRPGLVSWWQRRPQAGVGDLVVVLEEVDERRRRQAERRRAARLLLPACSTGPGTGSRTWRAR